VLTRSATHCGRSYDGLAGLASIIGMQRDMIVVAEAAKWPPRQLTCGGSIALT